MPESPSTQTALERARERVRRWQIDDELDADLDAFESRVREDERARFVRAINHAVIDIRVPKEEGLSDA